MLVDGISKDDIKQGILGDCWFLSSCAAVSQQEKFMRRVIDYNTYNFYQIFLCSYCVICFCSIEFEYIRKCTITPNLNVDTFIVLSMHEHFLCGGSSNHTRNVLKCDGNVWVWKPRHYRPQRSCGNVMFSQASVILFTGGVCQTPPGRHPLVRHTPRADTL